MPDINLIPDKESTPQNIKQKTIENYQKLRKSLYDQDSKNVDIVTGKIKDEVLMASIIDAEFGVFKSPYPDAYNEALEALSNQYDVGRIKFSNPGNMRCFGSCTIETQIEWLYDMEGVRSNKFIPTIIQGKEWKTFADDAISALNGYSVGEENSSWFWGNVTQEEKCKYSVVKSVYWPNLYPDKPYFIVHRGWKTCVPTGTATP